LSKIHEEELQEAGTFEESKEFNQICERLLQKAESFKEFRKFSQICQRLQQRTVSFKELVKFFQIFERFTNFSSARENPCKNSKKTYESSQEQSLQP
jgi:hypothetical protein